MVKYKHNGICSFITFFSICVYFMSRSINSACPLGNFIPPLTFEDWFAEILPPPPPPRLKVCSNAVPKCQIQWPVFFAKGKISDENFMSVISCEPSARWSEHFTFKLLHIKIYNTSILLEKQISHTTQVRFKLFPRSGSENSQLPVGFPAKGRGGGEGKTKIRIDRRIRYN